MGTRLRCQHSILLFSNPMMLARCLKKMPADNLPERYPCFLAQIECHSDIFHYVLHVIRPPIPLMVERYLRPLTWGEHQLQNEKRFSLLLIVLVCCKIERFWLSKLSRVVLCTAHAKMESDNCVLPYLSNSASLCNLTCWASLKRLMVLSQTFLCESVICGCRPSVLNLALQ